MVQRGIVLLGVLLSLVTQRSARAEVEADITVATGAGAAIPTGSGTVQPVISATLPVHAVIADHHGVGGVVRVHFIVDGLLGGSVAASYRFFLDRSWSVRPFVGASAGVGIWGACVRGDYCGGFGPNLGAELGIAVPLAPEVALSVSLENLVQWGLVNAVGELLIPGAMVGLTF